MRAELSQLTATFPKAPAWRDPGFVNSPLGELLTLSLPSAIAMALPEIAGRFRVTGSAGKGGWTHTPWVAMLDPAVTTTVEEGFYVVYLLSHGAKRLYLSLNQGCTTLKDSIGISGARAMLIQRGDTIRSRIKSRMKRLSAVEVNLDVANNIWRGKLYECGAIAGVEYDASRLPAEEELVADLREALQLYAIANQAGGWEPDDAILHEAEDAGVTVVLSQAKIYRQHRAIERQSSHSKAVKKALGTRCMACGYQMSEIYGPLAEGVVDVHHLSPLSTLADGQTVTYDAHKDFAVLCPNCHRTVHRMTNPGDIEGLRHLINNGALKKPAKVSETR